MISWILKSHSHNPTQRTHTYGSNAPTYYLASAENFTLAQI